MSKEQLQEKIDDNLGARRNKWLEDHVNLGGPMSDEWWEDSKKENGDSMFDNNVTIMKYKTTSGEYKFEVLDRFNEPDEAKRLDQMILLSEKLRKQGILEKQLWIKNTPII